MLTLENFTLQRSTKVLFNKVNLTIHSGQRLGIVGANGTGKSTLFAAIRDLIHPDQGNLFLPKNITIAHVAQETPAVDISALEYVLQGDEALGFLEKQLQTHQDNPEKLAQLHAEYEAIDGYNARYKAMRLLYGLGFDNNAQQNPVKSFSGGWRMRLNLAQALMCRSDMLLLDEPTNHLDLAAILWLEQWLKNYKGTLLLISHDREFLDHTVSGILHIENQSIHLYTGTFSDFENQRAEKLAQQQALYEKQQKEIEHLQSFINRFKAKASKAKQAQSRVKALEKMEKISAIQVNSPFYFSFSEISNCPNPLITIDKANIGYQDKIILNNINFSIEKGARVGILGPNGAGKSTFIKVIANLLKPLSGQYHISKGVKIAYFAQHQLEYLDENASPMEHFIRLDPAAREQSLRDFLGGFNFCGDMALNSIKPFSGGEKARLALALVVYQNPHLLLLDEPTNHLDLEMRDALNLALQDYQGALLLVSHDRYLMQTSTDKLLLVAHNKIEEFTGDLEDYSAWLQNYAQNQSTDNTSGNVKKEQRKESAAKRKQLSPFKKKLEKIEKEMSKWQGKQEEIEVFLGDGNAYNAENKEKLQENLKKQAEIKEKLENLEEQWFEISEEMEDISKSE